ncbi:unnamed protein product [Phaeothamnion confervicola]
MMYIYRVEQAVKQMAEGRGSGGEVNQLLVMFDRTGAGRKNVDMTLWKHVVRILQDNYPERLYRCVVYPAGPLFRSLHSIFSLFLDRRSREKFVVLGRPEGILDFVDRAELPRHLGGDSDWVFDPERDV